MQRTYKARWISPVWITPSSEVQEAKNGGEAGLSDFTNLSKTKPNQQSDENKRQKETTQVGLGEIKDGKDSKDAGQVSAQLDRPWVLQVANSTRWSRC
jgi:hypothetical protein